MLIAVLVPIIKHTFAVTPWIIYFMLHIFVITPLQTDAYINELVEIFLKLAMKTVQVHLIVRTILVCEQTFGGKNLNEI